MKTETRNSARKLIRCPAVLTFPNAEPMRGRTKDLSLGGVSVLAAEQLAPGTACTVTFDAPLNGKVVRISANAKVAYSILSGTEGFRIGLQFTHIDPASYKALSELMM